MKRRNSKQKTLDKWEIHYGTFTMPPEFWAEYPHVPPQVVIVDDRTHTHISFVQPNSTVSLD